MQLSITDIPGGAAGRDINAAVDGSGGRTFRHVILLDFKTGGQPDRIVVDAETSRLAATFLPRDHNALSAASPVSAAIRSEPALAQAVRVTLERPWQIAWVYARSSGDGAYVWAEPAAGGSVGAQAAAEWTGHGVEHEWEHWAHEAAVRPAGRIQFHRADGDAVAPEATTSAPNGSAPGEDFISADFALRLVSAGGAPLALTPADLTAVVVRGFPTGPRIGLAPPGEEAADTTAIDFFWQLPGEIRDAAATTGSTEDGGRRLAEALQRLLDAYLQGLRDKARENGTAPVIPDQVQVPLVIESDAPCQVKLSTLAICYRLIRTTLSAGQDDVPQDEKIRLRFPGDQTTARRVYVSLPGGATVDGVRLKVAPAFGGSPAREVNEGNGPTPAPDAAHGVALETERRAAVQVTPAAPLTACGLGLPLLTHAEETVLQVSLQEDWNGLPAGRSLAAAQVTLDAARAKGVFRVDFGTRLALFPQPYWIVVSTAKGAGVWLGRPHSAGRVLLLPPAGAQGGPMPSPLTGIEPGHLFFAPSVGSPSPAAAPFEMTAGGQAITPVRVEKDAFIFENAELKAALNAQLAASSGTPPPAAHRIALAFTTALAGGLTVYPIEISYAIV